MDHNRCSGDIVDAAMRVHSALGPGALEKAYRVCLAYELRKRHHDVQVEVPLPIIHDEVRLDAGYRIDLLVDHLVIVEAKAVARALPVHEAQLLSHLKLSGIKLGLLINFHEHHLRDGITRLVNRL